MMVNDFNRLMDEQRYAEAEVLAKRAAELDPRNPVVEQLNLRARMAHGFYASKDIKQRKEDGVMQSFLNCDEAAVPFDDNDPIRMPDAKKWGDSRRAAANWQRTSSRRTEQEMEIEKKLEDARLGRLPQYAAQPGLGPTSQAGRCELHLDSEGLAQEGVSSDTPVSIELARKSCSRALESGSRAAALRLRGQG